MDAAIGKGDATKESIGAGTIGAVIVASTGAATDEASWDTFHSFAPADDAKETGATTTGDPTKSPVVSFGLDEAIGTIVVIVAKPMPFVGGCRKQGIFGRRSHRNSDDQREFDWD